MAGEEHLIDLSDEDPPWPLLLEVAEATPEDSWVLVGGLMVHLHALRAGIVPSRPTRDVDLLLDIGAVTVGTVAGPLQQIGFRPVEGTPSSAVHRFTRDQDVIDVMVERAVRARWARRPVFQAPAARQALDRRDRYLLRAGSREVRVGVPDALGAIVAKAAAYREDQRDRGRHLDDLTVLLASSGGRRRLGLERLALRDIQHLRPAMEILTDESHPAWSVLELNDRAIGHRVLAVVADAIA